jgi:hypothetical protein
MDTMKILLGATVALLLGALVMSWNGLNRAVANPQSEEFARYKQDMEMLKLDIERLKTENKATELRYQTAPPAPVTVVSPSAAELEATKIRLAEKEAELQQLEIEKQKAERDKKLSQDEAGEAYTRQAESRDLELRRARQISQALVMGKVKEYVESAEVGDIVVIEVLMPEQVQPGVILGIRRNTGILAQIKVTEVTSEGAIGSPLAGFGPAKPEVGDELILPPQL